MSDLTSPRPAGHRRGRRRRPAAEQAIYTQIRTVAYSPAYVLAVVLVAGWIAWQSTGSSPGRILAVFAVGGMASVVAGLRRAHVVARSLCQEQAQEGARLTAAVQSIGPAIANAGEELRQGGRPSATELQPAPRGEAGFFVGVESALVSLQGEAIGALVRTHEQSQLAVRHRMFRLLARREHALVRRALEAIYDVQKATDDPALLAKLFHIDHLATRLRRLVESVAVIGGESARSVRKPLSVVNVLRNGVAEIENYPRVRVAPGVHGAALGLPGHVGPDVTHLIAELVENATKFSRPDTKVHLQAELVATGLAIEVSDRGLTMAPEMRARMNQLLAAPEQVDVSTQLEDGHIGVLVAALIAQRHRIHVRLQPNAAGGTDALIIVPRNLLVQVAAPDPAPEPEITTVESPSGHAPRPVVAAAAPAGAGLPQRRRAPAPSSVAPQAPGREKPQLPTRVVEELPMPAPETPSTGRMPAASPGLAAAFRSGFRSPEPPDAPSMPPSEHGPTR